MAVNDILMLNFGRASFGALCFLKYSCSIQNKIKTDLKNNGIKKNNSLESYTSKLS